MDREQLLMLSTMARIIFCPVIRTPNISGCWFPQLTLKERWSAWKKEVNLPDSFYRTGRKLVSREQGFSVPWSDAHDALYFALELPNDEICQKRMELLNALIPTRMAEIDKVYAILNLFRSVPFIKVGSNQNGTFRVTFISGDTSINRIVSIASGVKLAKDGSCLVKGDTPFKAAQATIERASKWLYFYENGLSVREI